MNEPVTEIGEQHRQKRARPGPEKQERWSGFWERFESSSILSGARGWHFQWEHPGQGRGGRLVGSEQGQGGEGTMDKGGGAWEGRKRQRRRAQDRDKVRLHMHLGVTKEGNPRLPRRCLAGG